MVDSYGRAKEKNVIQDRWIRSTKLRLVTPALLCDLPSHGTLNAQLFVYVSLQYPPHDPNVVPAHVHVTPPRFFFVWGEVLGICRFVLCRRGEKRNPLPYLRFS